MLALIKSLFLPKATFSPMHKPATHFLVYYTIFFVFFVHFMMKLKKTEGGA